ncbi:MAG: glycosyltransferase family 4 protein [Anaerolineae bacterium]|nr:glycosyltransferase family 4 protein [Anaerolineae bacterium]
MIAPTSFFSDYGCSVRILEEARVLQRLGHEVTVCTYRNGQDVPGLTIRRTPGIPFREHYEVGSSPHKIGFDFLLLFTVLVAALRRRPDVIHAHMHEGALIGLIVGGLLRLPMVFDFQGSLTGEMLDHKFVRRDSIFYKPLCWLETVIDRLSPAIVTSSRNAQKLLTDQFGCSPDRVEAVADCVDLEVFYPPHPDEQSMLDRVRAQLGIPAHRRTVVYLGLLADYQGTDALLHAAAQLVQRWTDVHFLIMGFPAVEYYQGMAHALGIADHVTFTGKVPYGRARDYLVLGDVAVAPKMSATEGSGKILNYMALGLPTVAFDTPVSREYLGEQGFYAQPGDSTSLADALHTALSRADSAQRGAALRHMAVERYRWECAAQTILHTYDRVCQQQPVVL